MVFRNTLKRLSLPFIIGTTIYTVMTLAFIYIYNGNSAIHFAIEPYSYASDPLCIFFPLVVTLPFSWYTYYFKKNGLYNYISLRENVNKYLLNQIGAAVLLCFIMVVVVNVIGIIFSINIANVRESSFPVAIGGIGADMQMKNPLLFGVIWSVYYGFLGVLICIFGQIVALYVKNVFAAMIAPFIYVFLENSITANLLIPQYSFTTAMLLNRLQPEVMTIGNISVGIVSFIMVIVITFIGLRKHESSSN